MEKCNVCYQNTLELIKCRKEETFRTSKEKWVRYHTDWKCTNPKCGVLCVDHSFPQPEKL